MEKHPRLGELFLNFLKLGFTAFGGPGMIFVIKRLVVEEKKWIDKETFFEGVALVQAIPGATAVQMAGYVGLKLKGLLGGFITFTSFILPAFSLMIFLSFLYTKTYHLYFINKILFGLKILVIAIVLNAFLDFFKPIYKRKSTKEFIIVVLSFLLFYSRINPFFIILFCFILSQFVFKTDFFYKTSLSKNKLNYFNINKKILVFLFSFLTLSILLLYFLDYDLLVLFLKMIKIDLFAFGGAYASLPLMLYEFVYNLKWIDKKTFLDGLALGQITPGPIVITATFVGFILKGFIGAIIATLGIFLPSFVLLLIATQFSQKIQNNTLFIKGKKGLLASFSGLLLFITLKFTLEISWNFFNFILFLSTFLGIYKKISLFYILFLTILFSIFLL